MERNGPTIQFTEAETTLLGCTEINANEATAMIDGLQLAEAAHNDHFGKLWDTYEADGLSPSDKARMVAARYAYLDVKMARLALQQQLGEANELV